MVTKNTLRNIICVSLVIMLAACGGAEERKQKYLEKGKTYFEENNLDKAKIEFKNVLQIDPKFAEAYYFVGQVEEREKNIVKAIGNYKKAIELDPAFTNAKVKLAKIYVVIGTEEYLDKARELLAEVHTAAPDNVEAQLISATIEYKVGNKDQALLSIEDIVSRDASLVEGISLLSAIYADRGQAEKAMKLLEKGVKDNRESIPLKISLAKIYAQQRHNEKAEKEILDIIAMKPENYAYRLALFSLYTTTNQMEKAEQVLRKAIADDSEDARRHLVLVEFISRNKSIGEAEAELRQSIDQNPSIMGLRFALAEFYRKIDNIDKAREVLNKIIEINEYDKDEINATIELASIAFDQKEYAEARKLVEQVLEEYPNNNDALLIRGKLALVNRDAETAVNDLRTVFKNDPKNPEAANLLAGAHEIGGQSALAEEVLKKSMENNPVEAITHYNYARYLLKKKRNDEAASIVDKALAYFDDSYELMELKLRLVAQQGNEDEILKILEKMKKALPNREEPYLKKGQYQLVRKDYARAREEFEQALMKSANKYQALEYIVNSYLAEKAPEKAVARINDRLSRVENDAMSYQLLGKVYYSQKETEKARQHFQKAIDAQSSWIVPYLNLASTYMAENDTANAMAAYEAAIANARNASPARLQLATLYERDRKLDKAIEQYRIIIQTEPDNLVVANNLASLIVENNPSDEDIKLALELTRDFSKLAQPAFLDTLGWVYVKSGQYEKAIPVLRNVVEKAPDVAVFKYHLGVALSKQGQTEEARKYLQEAVDSNQQFIGKDQASQMLGS